MARDNQTYYEILGVKPNAKLNDIGLAYNRLMAARRRADAPPDLKGETRLKEAHAVLSDLDRRAAYDAELARARLKPSFGAKQGVLAVVLIAGIAGAVWYYTLKKPAEEAARPVGKPVEEIAADATPAVGRLSSMDMSGQTKALGIAFAIDKGVMVSSCQGIAPNTQLVVNLTPRQVPARLTMVDEALGLCKLEVDGAGSWPLQISGAEARGGDIVYGAHVNAVGQVVLTQAKVKRVAPAGRGKVVESTLRIAPENAGAPMLDVYGRVVAVATHSAGEHKHVIIPSKWIEQPAEATAAPAAIPAERAADAPPGAVRPAPSMPNAPGSFTPERAEKLHKAFRPPPNVPDDIDK